MVCRCLVLPSLRLHGSYGYTGNSNNTIPAVLVIKYSPSGLSVLTGTPVAAISNPPNPDLRWEEVSVLNLAMDFSALQGRVSGSIEWYQKKSSDVLADFH